MKKTPPRTSKLNIINISDKGNGTSIWNRPDGKCFSVEVPFSYLNDEVLVELRKIKNGYEGRPLEWLQLSENRVIPKCKHFGSCGGCRWQHISYEDQLHLKEKKIRNYFERLNTTFATWHSIIPCDPPWNYRNKMEFSFSTDKAGKYYLGLILYGTRGHVFKLEECHLASPWVTTCVDAVLHWWEKSGLDAYHGFKDTGTLRTLMIREGHNSGDRLVMLTVSGHPDYAISQKLIRQFIEVVKEAVEPNEREGKLSIFLRIQQIAKGKSTQFYEMHLYGPEQIRETIFLENEEKQAEALNFQISPNAFFQPNTRQVGKLYSKAIELTQLKNDDVVYDLYCGAGTIGICLAKHVKEVIGIEIVPESVLDARENIQRNQLNNITIFKGDVGDVLSMIKNDRSRAPDVVMVDPPRSGLDPKAMKHLIELNAPKITYISCNPATQALNVEVLIQNGYAIQAIQPVDQFPHTVHIENIVVLSKCA
ncbi:MAG: 23S rRNA (uracil(1939)-C(5))-methyltransferase RlmD [Parachlamydiaceae bacterium]|nr:23S rRNA (uracil(1939)-C(5))-methyltransferase RlmD [Parachlamydiaceae bacterium]